VAFVGGSADAAEAMAASTIGIGVGADSWDLPSFAQVLLPSGRLLGVPRFLAVARRVMDVVRQNVFLGLAVSASAMVLTAILGVSAAPSDAHVALVPVVAACVAAFSRALSAARGEALARLDVDAPGPDQGSPLRGASSARPAL
jgi:Cu+-exporting ATPase